jgi:5-(carboxyamino)imidazole ribonucleotide mutase
MTVHPYNGAPFMNNVLKRKFAPMTTAPNPTATAQVGIVMGSQSDWDTMAHAARALREFGVPIETRIVSAHRTPQRLVAYATSARERGLKVIIAGAGGAAHLPGMVAAMTPLPVLGVPVESHALKGLDSLLSIVQMPGGVPVGTLAIGKAGAINAALLATAILALSDARLAAALDAFRAAQTAAIAESPESTTASETDMPATDSGDTNIEPTESGALR